MPEDMERKILDSVDQARQSVPKATAPGNRGWWPFAAGLAAGVLASIGLNWSVLQPAAISASLTDNLITAHVDSQIADHFIDFVSSDQHSVKPWFNGKVDYAVPVKDLSASGFILIGGRLDFISGKTVAVVAYQYRKHNVNLFVWPEQYWPHWRTGDESRRGYTLLSWDRDGFSYYLVSDLNPRELGRFRTLFEAAQ
jgi:anti-sigma factor RsiW